MLVNETNLVIKNGTLLSNTHALFSFVYVNKSDVAPKVFNVTVDNVDIGYSAGCSTSEPLFRTIHNNRTNGGGTVNFKFNNCDFDFETNAPTNKVPSIFNFYDPYNIVNVNAEISGGRFEFKTLDTTIVKLNVLNNGTDTIKYIPDDNGKYTTLEMPIDATIISLEYQTDSGVKYFGKVSTDGTIDYYELLSLETEYGTIVKDCASPLDYPFAVFKNGTFIGAYSTWKEAQQVAIDEVKGNDAAGETVNIILRRDYVNDIAGVDTLCDVGGTVVLDLNGYSITRSATLFSIIFNYTNGAIVSKTNIVIKNGTLLANNNALFTVLYINNSEMKDKTFDITLTNVDIGFASGATTTNPLMVIWDNGRNCQSGTVNLTLNSCDIDLTTNSPLGKTVILFNFYDKYDAVKVNAKINGGSFIAKSLANVKINSINSGSDSVIYGKEEGGNYTLLVLALGISAPTDEFDLANGKAKFVKVSEDSNTSTYRLRPIEVSSVDFIPKMSITLDRELIMNVYIPAQSLLKFTLDGIEHVNLEELTENEKIIDGKKYYLIKVALPAAEAVRDVVLVATISVGEGTATGTFTFSIPKYAEKVIASGNVTEITLVKDVLSYVRAAYVYFDKTDAAAMAKIDAILGENYDAENAPEFNGSAEVPTVGLESATLVLGATPAIRFYISGNADSYEFYVNGIKLNTVTDTNGEYIEMDVYAYAMCDTVIYYIDGVESGSYHINSYYEYAKTLDDAELVNLVERFAKYCESAKAYKAEATK